MKDVELFQDSKVRCLRTTMSHLEVLRGCSKYPNYATIPVVEAVITAVSVLNVEALKGMKNTARTSC